MIDQDKAKQLIAEARKIAAKVDSWISLSNALTDPTSGLIARHFPDPVQRQEFLRSPEYEQLNELLRKTIRRTGLYPPKEKASAS